MFVVRYVSQFRFTTSLRYDDIKIKNEVTISSVGGFPVSISKRESLKSQWFFKNKFRSTDLKIKIHYFFFIQLKKLVLLFTKYETV